MTRNQFGIALRRFVFQSISVAITLAAFATSAWAQANIDLDEHRTTPVPHRYIHGTLGDAEFQVALPDSWNGKLLIGARGFSGDELSAGEVGFVVAGPEPPPPPRVSPRAIPTTATSATSAPAAISRRRW